MNHALRFALPFALLAAACGPGSTSPADAGGDACGPAAPPRNDILNLNCTSLAGDEGAADCNQRLMNTEMGARFFIGGRSQCLPDPNNCACQPLCELTAISPMNCEFTTTTPGCRYSITEGYVIVVETREGRRWTAAVGSDGTCPSTGTGAARWARVGFEDLRGAAQCARTIPAGGFGPSRYGSCDTPMANCGGTNTPQDTCRQLNFMAGMTMYQANVCTHGCNNDGECGNRGVCNRGLCFNKCGGLCGLTCQEGFSCNIPEGATEGSCLPLPPQM
jgi:hypothetical protein